MKGCNNHLDHRYFVADVVLVPSEGNVVVLALCTACGDLLEKTIRVGQPNSQMSLKSLQKETKEV